MVWAENSSSLKLVNFSVNIEQNNFPLFTSEDTKTGQKTG